jgi:hypothetical protein
MLVSGLMSLFREVARQADEALFDEAGVMAQLGALHARFEAGALSEEEFDERELELVERLELIEARKRGEDE